MMSKLPYGYAPILLSSALGSHQQNMGKTWAGGKTGKVPKVRAVKLWAPEGYKTLHADRVCRPQVDGVTGIPSAK